MSGPDYPDAPPPEVPEEFAAAYRDAYRRALESEDPFAELPEVPAQEVVLVGSHRSEDEPATMPAQGWRTTRWFLPVAIAASALVLVSAAYAVGRALSGGEEPAAVRPSSARTSPAGTASPDRRHSDTGPATSPGGWDGPVTAVSVDAVAADCTAPPSNDSAGHRVTYVPKNAVDHKVDTAWRCPGPAIGQVLTLRFGADVDVAEVGLIPGYAKTDPESGVDRYAENNRITKVRWTLADGVSVVQRLDPDPSRRSVQLLRVPRTTTDTVTLEILAVKRAARNTTAISQIDIAAAD
jgi:hypothetical protein